MSNYTLKQIKETVSRWSKSDKLKQIIGADDIEITKNEDEVLLIDLTFEYCLAQIVVSNPTFAPYQYVSFEAMTLDSKIAQETGQPEMVYFFYDSANFSENDVMDELNFGVKLCSEYVPDQLREMYLNKGGLLNLKNANLYHVMHPNDVVKYSEGLVDVEFICTDIESQFLLVKNNLISLRVLPQVFTIK
ncbi:hypothetical protein [Paenibacillus massiliensis]|uniref:hypothetical protein n=1 Tax=Paenibacillus massiliensis TaxID=225917 RepID=UPI00048ADBAE|nr:hypothetical protein [Paenibacillus massiliensis]